MNRKTTKKVDESTLTTLYAVCRGAFLDAKGVRLRRADPRQLVKDGSAKINLAAEISAQTKEVSSGQGV